MGVKNLLDEIESDIKDMQNMEFSYSLTDSVPSKNDNFISFEAGYKKKGKILKSCILYADIRNSIALTEKHHTKTMGKIYSIFSKSILKIARYHSGFVRNIIGDRVMVVFPQENCFTNAVNCAISINSMSKIINKRFNVDFKCGIGIDYGVIKIIKVGIIRQGEENNENKSLVWVGKPANYASRLTDVANKVVDNTKMKVIYKPFNPFGIGMPNILGMSSMNNNNYLPEKTEYNSLEDFGKNITYYDTGISYKGGELINFERIEEKINYPAILMTDRVFNQFKKNNINRNSIKNMYWRKCSTEGIKDVNLEVYGGNVIWER